jgi:hypothetical protein
MLIMKKLYSSVISDYCVEIFTRCSCDGVTFQEHFVPFPKLSSTRGLFLLLHFFILFHLLSYQYCGEMYFSK